LVQGAPTKSTAVDGDAAERRGPMIWKDGSVYHSRDYYTAIVKEWLSYGGLNSRKFMRKTLARGTNEELADKVIAAGFVVKRAGFVREGLVQAIADYRQIIKASPVEDNDEFNRTLW
jgi:hypothetical protein